MIKYKRQFVRNRQIDIRQTPFENVSLERNLKDEVGDSFSYIVSC